jgi:hypothetical protein
MRRKVVTPVVARRAWGISACCGERGVSRIIDKSILSIKRFLAELAVYLSIQTRRLRMTNTPQRPAAASTRVSMDSKDLLGVFIVSPHYNSM